MSYQVVRETHREPHMKKALIAAIAALSATAWVATPAYAQRDDRGRHERGDSRGQRGDSNDHQRSRGDWNRDRGDARRGDRPQESRNDDALRGGPRARPPAQQAQQAQPPPQVQRGGADRSNWNRGGESRGDWNGNRGGDRRDQDGRSDWNRDNNNRGDWNRGGRDLRGNQGDNRGDWNRGDRNQRGDANRGDRNNRGDWNSRGGGRDFSRGDWNRDHRRDDDRWRRYRHTHRDWDRPRYSDWRHIRHGYYFDRGYAIIVGGFWGHTYYWWGYDGWRRPYRPWRVGYVLPYDIYWQPIPYDLYYRLPPAPYGCRYVMVDRDILLIAVSTGLILDALLYY